MNIKGHFETITRHKLLVMKYCFACGLYEQGLAHDLSKYSPTEFIPGCIYYQGDHSPNEAEREAKGYTSAWLHHKGRNKHHLEYWIDYSTTKAGLLCPWIRQLLYLNHKINGWTMSLTTISVLTTIRNGTQPVRCHARMDIHVKWVPL